MMYYSVSDTGILGKRKSECSYQESNLLKTFEPLSFERKTLRKRTCKPGFGAFFRYSLPVIWKFFLSDLLIIVFNGT